jgi:hypothetical protein
MADLAVTSRGHGRRRCIAIAARPVPLVVRAQLRRDPKKPFGFIGVQYHNKTIAICFGCRRTDFRLQHCPISIRTVAT